MVLSVFTYTYDNAGNRTAVAEANGDRVTWSYDAASQLLREQRGGTESLTFYCPAWSGLTGCKKKCLEEHESVHRGQCGPGEPSEQETEQEAYGRERQCLEDLLNQIGN